MTTPFYETLLYIDEQHTWDCDMTEAVWRVREQLNRGPGCCLRHFRAEGRSACRADRRGIEDCGHG